jgi:hypothetical protein
MNGLIVHPIRQAHDRLRQAQGERLSLWLMPENLSLATYYAFLFSTEKAKSPITKTTEAIT